MPIPSIGDTPARPEACRQRGGRLAAATTSGVGDSSGRAAAPFDGPRRYLNAFKMQQVSV
jgi:hypothetical protein